MKTCPSLKDTTTYSGWGSDGRCWSSANVCMATGFMKRRLPGRTPGAEFGLSGRFRGACERRNLGPGTAQSGDGERESLSREDNNLAAQFIESVIDQRRVGRRASAVITGLQWRLKPTDTHYYKALSYAVMPRWMINRVRRQKAR